MTASIQRNTEYVLDYGRLVDPVSYTVLYVDSQSGEQIATPAIVYANAGEQLTIYPKGIENYTASEEKQDLTLEKDADNTVTFHYTYSGEVETITTTVVNKVPGTTTTVEEINEIEQIVETTGTGNNGQQTGGAVTDLGNDRNANTGGNETPADNTDNTDDNQANGDHADDNTTDIQEEEPPLDDGTNGSSASDENNTNTIDDEEVPLAGGAQEASSNAVLVSMIGGILVALLAVIAAVVISRKKKAKK